MSRKLNWIWVVTPVLAACGGAYGHGANELHDGAGDVVQLSDGGSGIDGAQPPHGDDTDREEPPQLDGPTVAELRKLRYDEGALPLDPSNAFLQDKAAQALGQRLFFDASLSGRLLSKDNDGSVATLGKQGEAGRVNCASCHVPEGFFYDARSPHQQISLASDWTRRRAPTLLEAAFLPHLNWDGRHDSLWSQAIGVMESPVEFNSGRLFIAQQIFRQHRSAYEAVFGKMPALDDSSRFPALSGLVVGCSEVKNGPCRGKPGDQADYDSMSLTAQDEVTRVTVNAAKAISAYVSLLRCGKGRFDAWLDEGARVDSELLSYSEQRGAVLFVSRADCARCHSGPRLTDGLFHNVGLRPGTVAVAFTDTGDRGAAEGLPLAMSDPLNRRGVYSDGNRETLPSMVTPEHEGAFRTPTLRCVAKAGSFMHTGQLRTLEQVVAFFNQGGHPALGFPGTSEIKPLGLSDKERSDLVAFLWTLMGEGPGPELLKSN